MNRRKKELLAFLVLGSIFMVSLYYLQKSLKRKSKNIESDTEPESLPIKKAGFWKNLKRSFVKDFTQSKKKVELKGYQWKTK